MGSLKDHVDQIPNMVDLGAPVAICLDRTGESEVIDGRHHNKGHDLTDGLLSQFATEALMVMSRAERQRYFLSEWSVDPDIRYLTRHFDICQLGSIYKETRRKARSGLPEARDEDAQMMLRHFGNFAYMVLMIG